MAGNKGVNRPGGDAHYKKTDMDKLIGELKKENFILFDELRTAREELKVQLEIMRTKNEELEKATLLLRESEAKYRGLVENVYDWIWEVDEDNAFTYSSPRSFDVIGYRPEELFGKRPTDFMTPDESARVIGFLSTVFMNKTPVMGFSCTHVHRDGHTVWVEVNALPTFGPDGDFTGYRGIIRDITERRRMEDEFRILEGKSSSLIKYAPTGIYEVDFNGPRFVSVNDYMCQVLGYTREELLAIDPFEMLDNHSKAVFKERIGKWIAGEYVDDLVEYTGKTRDGREMYWSLKVTPTYSDGKLRGAVVVGYDITERRQAQVLSDALNNINMAINASLDFNRIMEAVAVEATKAIGFSRATVALREGRDWVLKYTYGDPQRPVGFRYTDEDVHTIKELLGRKKPMILSNTQNNSRANQDEARKFDVASSVLIPLVMNDEIIGIFSFSDSKTLFLSDAQIEFVNKLSTSLALAISNAHLYDQVRHELHERKQAEEELIIAKQQAELYLDLMGHDINNLHQIALGYLELARDMPSGEEQARFLDKPVEVLQRSALLIQNVRKLQKLRDGVFKTELIDVCEVLAGVQEEFAVDSGKRMFLNVNGHEHCYVKANELLHDVFANLVSNAIKHTRDQTNIIVDMDIVTENNSRYCRAMVEDDGPGIPDGFKAAIFNRTLKGTNKARGMGLGLYLVKSLVDSYGGWVRVEDRVFGDYAKGAKFVVMLPWVQK